jgi:hypothetical protein
MIVTFAATVALAGCASSFDLRKSIPWASSDEKIHEPLKVSAFWSNEVENRADLDHGIRGFGGRLYFYGKDPDKAVKVKGSLVIYAFDETNRDPKNMVPDKKYVFPAQALEKLYSKSQMGHSYSVWLPWDAVGGPQHEITLVARFMSEKGAMASSEPSKQLLPGDGAMPTASLAAAAGTATNFVQQASYQAAMGQPAGVVPAQAVADLPSVKAASQSSYATAGPAAQPEGSISTTTIPVPYGILNRQSNPPHGMPGPPPYQPPAGIPPLGQLPPGQNTAPTVVLPTPASMTLGPADQINQKAGLQQTVSPADPSSLKAGLQQTAMLNSAGLPAPAKMSPPMSPMQTTPSPTYSTPSGLPPVGLIQPPAARF